MNQSPCIVCKGRGLCGRPKCPILSKFQATEKLPPLGDDVFGASPPSVFVGRMGYPNIHAGPLVPPQISSSDAQIYDSPQEWLDKGIEDIIGLRSNLVRSNIKLNIKDASTLDNKFLVKTHELAMADMPVDTEVWFVKPPKRELRFDDVLAPMGPSGQIKSLDITENPSVPQSVDRLTSDTDALARDAVVELYGSGISAYHIYRLLSIGLLGKQNARRLAPTRWSITATDDILGKELIADLRDMPILGGIEVFSSQKLGNRFEILLLPRIFSFELIEIWQPKSVWAGDSVWIGADREGYDGKTTYSNLGGGYYSARLGVLEYLEKIRKQASVFIVREILPDYWAPLGSWVIQETVKDAMARRPKGFETVNEALIDIATRIRTPLHRWKRKAKILDNFKFQKRLIDYMSDTIGGH